MKEKTFTFAENFLKKMLTIKISKVRDHCNYAGKYRGAAKSICN